MDGGLWSVVCGPRKVSFLTAMSINPHAVVERIENPGDPTEGGSQPLQKGVFGLREVAATLRTIVDSARLPALDRIAAVAFNLRRIAGRTALF